MSELPKETTRFAHRRAGFTLAEVSIVVAIVGVIVALGFSQMDQWQKDQAAAAAARQTAEALTFARIEAIRTGNVHVVFLRTAGATDVAGNPLVDDVGTPVPLLILDDGPVGSPGQNCAIDAGETTHTLAAVPGLAWGFTASAGAKAPGDNTGVPSNTGSSFATPLGAASTWVAFRADGVPVAFNNACSLGDVGSGNGGIYFTNTTRDYAVVLHPLGGVRVHAWDPGVGQWTN